MIWLVLSSLLIIFIWWFTKHLLFFPWTYLLYLGMFLLLEVAVPLRHLRNISLIREIRKNGGGRERSSIKSGFRIGSQPQSSIFTRHSF